MTPNPIAFVTLRRVYVERQLFDLQQELAGKNPNDRQSADIQWWQSELEKLLEQEAKLRTQDN